MNLIKDIFHFIFGHKYRIVVLRRANTDIFSLCSYIFKDDPADRQRLRDYIEDLKTNRSFELHEVASFRSREAYGDDEAAADMADIRDFLKK